VILGTKTLFLSVAHSSGGTATPPGFSTSPACAGKVAFSLARVQLIRANSRAGFMLGPALGELAARMLTGRTTDSDREVLSALDLYRTPSRGELLR